MKMATERQKAAIYKLSQLTKTKTEGVENLSGWDASKLITRLQNKLNDSEKNDDSYKNDVLAGLAVKICAQQTDLDWVRENPAKFGQKVVGMYRVFQSARQSCLA